MGVPGSRFGEIAEALADFELFVVTGPNELTPLADASLAGTHQTWVREPDTRLWRLDVMREPSAGNTWICRRDPAITLPYARLIERTEDGIPYGRPEVTLLFKAKRPDEEKNAADLADTLPRLDPDRRRWLRDAIARVHPGHPWLEVVR